MIKKKKKEEKEKKEKRVKGVKVGLFQTAWQHIRRSPLQSLAAIMVMWLNFLVATALVVLVLGFASLLNYFESRPEVTAFLRDEATEVQVQQLNQQLSSLEGVKETKYVSKKDALEIYREQNKNNPLLLEMVTANILPASFEISAVSPDQLTKIAEFLEKEKEVVEEVIFQKDVVEKLSFWVGVIRNGGLAIAGILSLVSWVVIMVIIGMKIAAHADEISALRSLGADSLYIQAPFLLEGVIYGLVGFLLGWSLVFGAIFYWHGEISTFFEPILVLPGETRIIVTIFLAELLAGVVFGLMAAWMATRRYLRK